MSAVLLTERHRDQIDDDGKCLHYCFLCFIDAGPAVAPGALSGCSSAATGITGWLARWTAGR